MVSINASERRSSLLKTVWNRLNSAVSLAPQASAASVNSCCTAETWIAEISAWVAQALAACARLAPVKHNSVAQAPARKLLFIACFLAFDAPAKPPKSYDLCTDLSRRSLPNHKNAMQQARVFRVFFL